MRSFTIRHIPAFVHLGKEYAESWHVVLKCSRGLAWEGGEYASRDEAEAAGRRKVKA